MFMNWGLGHEPEGPGGGGGSKVVASGDRWVEKSGWVQALAVAEQLETLVPLKTEAVGVEPPKAPRPPPCKTKAGLVWAPTKLIAPQCSHVCQSQECRYTRSSVRNGPSEVYWHRHGPCPHSRAPVLRVKDLQNGLSLLHVQHKVHCAQRIAV